MKLKKKIDVVMRIVCFHSLLCDSCGLRHSDRNSRCFASNSSARKTIISKLEQGKPPPCWAERREILYNLKDKSKPTYKCLMKNFLITANKLRGGHIEIQIIAEVLKE